MDPSKKVSVGGANPPIGQVKPYKEKSEISKISEISEIPPKAGPPKVGPPNAGQEESLVSPVESKALPKALTRQVTRGGEPPPASPAPAEAEKVKEAVRKAQSYLLSLQGKDGSWSAHNRLGIAETSAYVIFTHFMGLSEPEKDRKAVSWILSQQRQDGSWPPYPNANHGSLDMTALGNAALQLLQVEEKSTGQVDQKLEEAIQKSQEYISRHGGYKKIRPDVGIMLVMGGILPKKELPKIPIAPTLIPGFQKLLGKHLASWITTHYHIFGGLAHGIKRGPHPKFPLHQLESWKIKKYLNSHQNQDGDYYGNALTTMMGTAALYAMGTPLAAPAIQKALQYVRSLQMEDSKTLEQLPFTSEIWDTAGVVSTLVKSGVKPDAPEVQKAKEFLLSQQTQVPAAPDWQNPPPGAPTTGAWGFEKGNYLAPDNDCVGLALLALSQIIGSKPAPKDFAAIGKGLHWILSMQNPDGGWGAWAYSNGKKKPGPIPPSWISQKAGFPIIMTDPSTEGLTGRILVMLGQMGFTIKDPPVARAVEFLRKTQESNGGWWERWGVNYLMGTSFVLGGLSRVGVDMSQDWIQKAMTWMKSKQNPDGGWGETPASYDDIRKAGIGPSCPTLTGMVVASLIHAGCQDSPEVKKGVEYLLKTQKSDGSWVDEDPVGTAFPSAEAYYDNPLFAKYVPLLALGEYASHAS